MALTWLPPPRDPLCSLSIPNLAFQSRCHFGRAPWCKFSQVRFMSLGFLLIYSFHAPFRPGSQNTETPIKVIPLRPGPCKKEPLLLPVLRNVPGTQAHTCVCTSRAGALPVLEEGARRACLRREVGEQSHFTWFLTRDS